MLVPDTCASTMLRKMNASIGLDEFRDEVEAFFADAETAGGTGGDTDVSPVVAGGHCISG